MTLGDLISVFRIRNVDTALPHLWTDEELAAYFTEAEEEAAVRSRLIFDTDELAVSTGEPVCDLPEKLFDIQYAELVAADGTVYEITGTTRRELDKWRPGWRRDVTRPKEYVHDDKTLTLGSAVDADYTMNIEFFRLPNSALENDDDTPEINSVYHGDLMHWVEHLAYSKPDADTFNPGKAAESEKTFERIFGKKPTADLRRKQNANRPHRNKAHL